MDQNQLIKIRNQIDEIDDHIFKLISERAALAAEVKRLKQLKQGQNDQIIYYRPEREAQILKRIKQENKSELPDEAMLAIFREIIAHCLALQKRLAIAFLGPKGTFSQVAVESHFGKAIDQMPVESIGQIFRETEAQTAHYGVVPIENTISGKVNQTFDELLKSPLEICGEIKIPVHQHLLRHPADDQPIKRIYSHQQSFIQCAQWLNQHMPNLERISVASNAQAAQLAQKEKGVAAIASELAAQLYGLKIVNKRIEDEPQNITRFIIIGKQSSAPSGDDKTSLLISTPHTPGTLRAIQFTWVGLDTYIQHIVIFARHY